MLAYLHQTRIKEFFIFLFFFNRDIKKIIEYYTLIFKCILILPNTYFFMFCNINQFLINLRSGLNKYASIGKFQDEF